MEFIDKYVCINTKEERNIIGKIKSIDYRGNIYLSHAVEVFDKEKGFYTEMDIFDNTNENIFSFDSEKNKYLLIGEICLNSKSINTFKVS